MTVRIVTDGGAQFLNPAIVAEHGITVLPRTIAIGTHRFTEPGSLNVSDFIWAIDHGQPPVVTAPSVDTFRAAYLDLARETGEILSIHSSQGFDAACTNARAAAQSILGRCTVHVLDSMTTSFSLGYLVDQVGKAATAGENFDALVKMARRQIGSLYALFYTESPTALHGAHVLSESHAMLSDLLDLRLLVAIEDGQLVVHEKARARPQAFTYLMEFIAGFHAEDQVVIVSATAGQEIARSLQLRLSTELGWPPCPMRAFNSTLGAALGSSAVGVLVSREYVEQIHAVSSDDDD